jgi:hypothetical protein
MTKYPELFAALAAPFEPHEIKTRSGGGGRQLQYITARVAMNRFDTVVGPENWRNRYRLESLAGGNEAVVCTIELKIDGEWIAKEDAGGFKEMTEKNRQGETVEDEENTVKTGYSDSFKRCAILWGVARYLYRDGVPNFDGEAATGRRRDRGEDRPPDRRSINEAFASAQETWQSYIGGRLRGMHDGWMREMVAADIETERRQENKEVCKEPEIVVYLCTRLVELGRVNGETVRDPMQARSAVLQAFAKSPASIKRAEEHWPGRGRDET